MAARDDVAPTAQHLGLAISGHGDRQTRLGSLEAPHRPHAGPTEPQPGPVPGVATPQR